MRFRRQLSSTFLAIWPASIAVVLISSLAAILTSLSIIACRPVNAGDSFPASTAPQVQASPPITRTVPGSREPRARFETISTAEGLSFFNVRPVLQDQRGFMWIGTYGGGLNKYDGYRFSTYKHDPDDPNTLSQDFVHSLYEDRDGDLWVGTESGLDRLVLSEAEGPDRTTEGFEHYLEGQGPVLSMYEDSTGTLWVGTLDELIGFDRAAETVRCSYHYDPDVPDDPGGLSGYAVWAIHEDRKGELWIGTGGGLGRLDRTTETFTHYRHDPSDPTSLSEGSVHAIYEDRQGVLWIGTYGGGLNQLVPSTSSGQALSEAAGAAHSLGTFIHYRHGPEDPHSLGDDRVTSILEDSAGTLWVGTFDGLSQMDRGQGHFLHHRHNPVDPRSLSSDLVWSLCEDRSGVVWIGTSAGGLSKYNRRANQFTHYTDILSDIKVSAIHQDRSGVLWIGTINGGLNRLDRRTESLTVYQHDPADPTSLSSNMVYAVYEDRAGVLWVGAGGWLERFDPQTETFFHHQRVGPNVENLVEDRSGNLWIGTAAGLYRLDHDRERLTSYHPVEGDPNSLSHHDIQVIYEDRAGVLWVGTLAGGINLWDPVHDRFTHYRHRSGDPSSLSRDGVAGIYEDTTGVVWIGTVGGGLNRFDRATQTFTHFRENDGLPGDSVGCILADSAGFLWLRTIPGLSRFDPRTGTFRNYDERDGLLSGGIAPMACFRNQTGEMFFSSAEGVYAFYPEQIKDNPHPPPIVITAFNLFNETVHRDLPPDKHVQLSHRENFISFEFAALDYTSPEKNRYAYIMEGLNDDWVYAETRRYADYPNLEPGNYVFRVKGSNSDGVWSEEGAAVHITIQPPFWGTWWFRVIVALVLVGGVIGGYQIRVRSIEARSRELERQVEERTVELRRETDQRVQAEEALRQGEMERAVTAERSRLARELHDAVTQTLFSASLIAEALPASWERDQDRGRQLLKELRQLTKGALAEMRTLLLELRPAALVEAKMGDLLRQLAEAATGREGLPVTVTAECEWVLPPDVHVALYRIAQEALNNIVKHSRASQAEVSLRCLPSATGGNRGRAVELRIRDDGRGFDPDSIPPDRLGLGIMQERAQAIGATLAVASEPGDGTEVRVVWEEDEEPGTKDE